MMRLQVFLKHGDVPKALLHRSGLMLLTQFHPEMYFIKEVEGELDSPIVKNKAFFDYFLRLAAFNHGNRANVEAVG